MKARVKISFTREVDFGEWANLEDLRTWVTEGYCLSNLVTAEAADIEREGEAGGCSFCNRAEVESVEAVSE